MVNLKTEIRLFCAQHKLRLNKDLGQHFLVDQEILDAIVKAGDIQKDDTIVEIGPGIGVLTKELVARCDNVTAIEIDQRLIPLLKIYIAVYNEQPASSHLQIINNNALQTPLPKTPYKVIANIPYHITSPLLRHVFIESETSPTSLTLLIQKEVADRICDTKSFSLLTILVRLFGTPHIVCPVSPSCFTPPPKVDSAVIHIECFEKPLADAKTLDAIFKLTKVAFSQKRKKLRNTLAAFPDVLERLKALEIDENRRPQDLSVEEWIAIVQTS
ncbi:MAG: 16S rRNA (adenine(1518)-N(6)/adenine(1519)-N(6))-dimethyltransferase RsmA [bacterium]|nr:16S rRNA (adenine(1518)-N(6)/adenine(1519)-N(6))-dimethyltransferase RsmA [bacterium]